MTPPVRAFADGHQAVLRAAGITNLTSFNTDWMGDPDATCSC